MLCFNFTGQYFSKVYTAEGFRYFNEYTTLPTVIDNDIAD